MDRRHIEAKPPGVRAGDPDADAAAQRHRLPRRVCRNLAF